ncbi:hypothetical protein HQ529_03585 [Candidatus Woesearchaeota archaeon]|nr:hypothetical protein [Candidatus Woesearchaeota archaeon]
MKDVIDDAIKHGKILDDLFIDEKFLKLLVKTEQWNKLINVIQNHRDTIVALCTRVERLEGELKHLVKNPPHEHADGVDSE